MSGARSPWSLPKSHHLCALDIAGLDNLDPVEFLAAHTTRPEAGSRLP
ncbi:hypothetical protein AB0K14_38380 [Actinosynnema sp. NPDC050801]